jgi:hypothetical protein
MLWGYQHSVPSSKSIQNHEWHAPLSPSVSAAKINHACPSLFTWATNLVTDRVHYEIDKLTVKDNEVHLCASTNDQHPGNFSITRL